jgi:hypothetical protein
MPLGYTPKKRNPGETNRLFRLPSKIPKPRLDPLTSLTPFAA